MRDHAGMNLDGYTSEENSSDGSKTQKPEIANATLTQSAPSFVVSSGIQTTFGGTFRRAFPTPNKGTKRKSRRDKASKKQKRVDPEQLDYHGPWAGSSTSDEISENPCSSGDESTAHESELPQIDVTTKSTELTESYVDYPFMEVPSIHTTSDNPTASFTKRIGFTLSGHAKGVTRLRFIPRSGHLLLSCGNDSKIFLWNVSDNNHSKVRGYFGHTQAVKDVIFTADGCKFLSCSYDNTIILWKTETGEILQRLSLEATANCAIFNPLNENEVVVGLANRRIEHYDLTTPESPIQVYDHHLGAINSLTALSSVFVSTSDDRTVRFWKWHINIPTKIIADPTQNSIPCTAAHPSESYLALQSFDDAIYVVQGSGKYRFNKSKTFKGHKVAGYGIDLGFSSDGAYIMSGDTNGHVFVWSWRRREIVQKLKVSDGVVTCLATHPYRPNVLAAAGKRGEIYVCK
ncbi:hypothetical protein OXX69_003513 [Metschnikowia pulcherrima]